MRRIIALFIAFLLMSPCLAQAYSIQPVIAAVEGTQFATSVNDSQALFSMSSGATESFSVYGAFRILSDSDPDASERVSATLTSSMTLSTYGFIPGSAPGFAESHYFLNIADSADNSILTDTDQLNKPALPGALDSLKVITSFDFFLDTKEIYAFVFSGDISQSESIAFSNWETILNFTTPDVAPTPLPGAVWLLGSGVLGLAGLRKKMCG